MRIRELLVGLAVVLIAIVFLLLTSIGGSLWAALVLGELALFVLALGLLPYGIAAVLRWTRDAVR